MVDDPAGFVGGINLIDDRIDPHHGTSELPRLDFAVRVTGPLVADAQHAVTPVVPAADGHDVRPEIDEQRVEGGEARGVGQSGSAQDVGQENFEA